MNEPTTIRSERLLLRPFSFNDVEDVLAYASDASLDSPASFHCQTRTRFAMRRSSSLAPCSETGTRIPALQSNLTAM